MKRQTLLMLGLSTLLLTGCERKDEEPAAHVEEPFTPRASLDYLDAAAAEPTDTAADVEITPPIDDPATDLAAETTEPTLSDEVLAPMDEAAIGGRVHIVQKGDTLYALARTYYNDQAKWRDIWDANRTRLADPNKLEVGMKLIIP